jgi:hypothetical protein
VTKEQVDEALSEGNAASSHDGVANEPNPNVSAAHAVIENMEPRSAKLLEKFERQEQQLRAETKVKEQALAEVVRLTHVLQKVQRLLYGNKHLVQGRQITMDLLMVMIELDKVVEEAT